jgi:hypothetical protein
VNTNYHLFSRLEDYEHSPPEMQELELRNQCYLNVQGARAQSSVYSIVCE